MHMNIMSRMTGAPNPKQKVIDTMDNTVRYGPKTNQINRFIYKYRSTPSSYPA